ncbi:MAG TPA: DUF748 domain-containing protein [Azospira sp.]|nr:DUF748 domain-containing protein [Azospira sp.]
MLKKIDPAALVRHPRTRTWAIRVAAFFAVVGVLGFLAVPPLLKWVLVSQLGKALQREVTIESVSLNPYTLTATIRGLSVREGGGKEGQQGQGGQAEASTEIAGFDTLRLNAELGSIFVAGAIVKEIELAGPRLRLTRYADKRYNVSDLLDSWLAPKPEPETPASPPRFSVSNIQISGGRFEFDDRFEGVQHAITDLTLRLPFVSSLSFNADTYVEPHFSATINGAPLVLTGKSRPFAETHESELSLDLDNLQLARYWAYSPVDMPVRIDAGALDGTLRLRFLQGAAQSQLALDGSLALKDFRLVEASGAPLLAVKRLDLGLREADLIKLAVGIERIAIDSPEVDVRIDKHGMLNWLAVLPATGGSEAAAKAPNASTAPPPKAAATSPDKSAPAAQNKPAPEKTAPAKAAPASPLRLTVDTVEVKGGALRLLDQSTGSDQRVTLKDIGFQVRAYDSGGDKPMVLSLAGKLDAGDPVQLDEVAVRDASLDLNKRELRIGEYAMRGMRLKVTRGKDGSLQFLRAPALKTAAAGKPEQPGGSVTVGKPGDGGKAGSEPSAWRITVDKVSLADHLVRFEDLTHSPTATQLVDLQSMEIANLSTAADAEATVAAKFRINKKGEAEIAGKLRPLAPAGTLQLSLNQIELLPLQPYFGELLNLTVTRGVLTAKGELGFAPGAEAPAVTYKGNLTLGDFHSVEQLNSTNFLRWKSFHFGDIDLATSPLAVSVGQVALTDFFARVIVSPEGKLNLMHLVKRKDEPAPAPAEAAAAAAAEEKPVRSGDGRAEVQLAEKPEKAVVPVRIGKVTLQGGRINFTDNFVKPNYSANLTQMGGRINGLSSKAGTVADLELRGSYNDLAPLTITAKLNPFAAKSYLDLDAEVKGIELSGFSPYSGKYAGYAIEKGKLSLFLKYKIEDNVLAAENRVFLDQLTFGETVDSPDATKLPVTLAVALLKNRAGEIDINLPIAGSLDDPEFSVGGIIVKVIVNLFVKAVTSPFALLGSLFGGGEEMAYVEFDYGYAALSAAMKERLQTMAKALEDRPGLKIELSGRIDPDSDREGLKKAMMERRVKAQRLEELVKQGTEAGAVDDVEIPEKDYPRYLEKAYKAEKFPKPRNVVGLVKTLPVEEMEKLMLANMNADDEALRRLADRRASNVAQWLTTEGKVASERVFVLQPHLTPKDGPQQEKARHSRVDFSLK